MSEPVAAIPEAALVSTWSRKRRKPASRVDQLSAGSSTNPAGRGTGSDRSVTAATSPVLPGGGSSASSSTRVPAKVDSGWGSICGGRPGTALSFPGAGPFGFAASTTSELEVNGTEGNSNACGAGEPDTAAVTSD